MDEILKFQRIPDTFGTILSKNKISVASSDLNHIVLGTESGVIYIFKLSGKLVTTIKSYSEAINDLSIEFDNNFLTILSCSDSGIAILATLEGNEKKESIFNFSEPIKCIALDPKTRHKKEKSFFLGTQSGKLIHHKANWFTFKNIALFQGHTQINKQSPVLKIACQQTLIAWADSTSIRIMNTSNQSAICLINAPMGVTISDPMPCSLFWEGNDNLLVGWGDRFRHVQIHTEPDLNSPDGIAQSASILHEWSADTLICGLSPFDSNHVLLLGYFPPDDDEIHQELHSENMSSSSFPDEQDEQGSGQFYSGVFNQPEIIIARRTTGEFISADLLPMNGLNMKGPFGYVLLSSYSCQDSSLDAMKWDLFTYKETRGGDRGNAPISIVLSPQDLIVARIRDTNDRIAHALSQYHLKQAVYIARDDKNSLRKYNFKDLLSIYLIDLLERGELQQAAVECSQLIDQDTQLWSSWIKEFIHYQSLEALCPYIPINNPRLPQSLYEDVLDYLLEKNSFMFFQVIKKWAKVFPVCFDHNEMIKQIDRYRDRHGGSLDSHTLEAQAQLYIISRNFEKALNCYLDIKIDEHVYLNKKDEKSQQLEKGEYRHVFELIEKQGLFPLIENKILNLVRLSKPLSAKLLLHNIDKLPIRPIAKQLSVDKRLLFWYLDILFKDKAALDTYSNPHEYGDLHALQTQLYAEFSPSLLLPKPKEEEELATPTAVAKEGSKPTGTDANNPLVSEEAKGSPTDISSGLKSVSSSLGPTHNLSTRTTDIHLDVHFPESDFMQFLRSGLAPLDTALSLCEKRSPPLYLEIIYIHTQLANPRKALQVLLNDIGDINYIVKFIEDFIRDENQVGNKRLAKKVHDKERYTVDVGHFYKNHILWDDLVDYCLIHKDMLESLLDYLGICQLNPVKVVSKIPPHQPLPFLSQRIKALIQNLEFQTYINESSNLLLEEDVLNLLRRKNQGQHRAMKIESHRRCFACSRPLFLEPPSIVLSEEKVLEDTSYSPSSSSSKKESLDPRDTMSPSSKAIARTRQNFISNAQKLHIDKASIQVWGVKHPLSLGRSHETKYASSSTHPSSSSLPGGIIVLSNKIAFHRACYDKLK